MKFVLAITGASGASYGVRLLYALVERGQEVSLVVSPTGAEIVAQETGRSVETGRGLPPLVPPEAKTVTRYHFDDLMAPIASGSVAFDGMVIAPASMGTVGRLAAGTANDLIARAADVCLKEHRKLIIVPRESPMSLIHLRNLSALAEAGATIMPACPAFYGRPASLDDLVAGFVGRILDLLGVENDLAVRWGEQWS